MKSNHAAVFSLWPTESGTGPTWSTWCGGEGEIPERSGRTRPLNGWNTTSTMPIPSLRMRSKSRPSTTSGWVQSLLLSLATLEKTVSINIHCNIIYRWATKEVENKRSLQRKQQHLRAIGAQPWLYSMSQHLGNRQSVFMHIFILHMQWKQKILKIKVKISQKRNSLTNNSWHGKLLLHW